MYLCEAYYHRHFVGEAEIGHQGSFTLPGPGFMDLDTFLPEGAKESLNPGWECTRWWGPRIVFWFLQGDVLVPLSPQAFGCLQHFLLLVCEDPSLQALSTYTLDRVISQKSLLYFLLYLVSLFSCSIFPPGAQRYPELLINIFRVKSVHV